MTLYISKLKGSEGGDIYSEPLGMSLSIILPDLCDSIAVVTKRDMVSLTVGIAILSDRQAAVRGLSPIVLNSGIIYECQRYLNKLAKWFKVHVIWVPGQSDVPGNCWS